jgi:ribosomal protein L11 methylase PrmA
VSWILTINVDEGQIDPITDRLWDLGTNGVATIPTPAGIGSRLLAGFESEAVATTARTILGGAVTPVDPAAWETPDVVLVEVGGRSLAIDAGHSFGHGKHPTTQLCIRALESHLRPGTTVLDVGCGSGVLSLTAAALGASSVSAIDIDPAAIVATTANAASNGIELDISANDIADLDERFDVVVVNMLIAELEPIADDVQRLAGDMIIVSGALIEQRERVRLAFPSASLIEENVDGDWAGHVYRTGGNDPMNTEETTP